MTLKVNLTPKTRVGPKLDRDRLNQLPRQYGPGPISTVMRRAIQDLVNTTKDENVCLSQMKS